MGGLLDSADKEKPAKAAFDPAVEKRRKEVRVVKLPDESLGGLKKREKLFRFRASI